MSNFDTDAETDAVGSPESDIPALYAELKAIAHHLRLGLRPGDTLSTTVVVHEAFVRLAAGNQVDGKDREHLLATCARAMRFVLIDHIRQRNSVKHGASIQPLRLDTSILPGSDDPLSLIALHQGLEQLESRDSRLVRLIELRVFAGLEVAMIAEVLQVNLRTVQRDWKRANAWLTAGLL